MPFELLCTDGTARRGRLSLPHGVVETPIFMPVGTQATVKGLTCEQLKQAGTQILLGNTYHLTLRPGDELIRDLGGLHRFMAWDRPILTDSGGYQVFSLAQSRQITDHGATFRSHIDGALLELTPEKAVAIQENLGADIAMCLDECPPADSSHEQMQQAVERTLRWAARCQQAARRPDQELFGIVQGGTYLDLREACARELVAMDFPGYALGGFSVGETPAQMVAALGPSASFLPVDKPRYLMGVGRPQDLVEGIHCGIDMFDCVMPTRSGRNALAFTDEGVVRLRNAKHRRDPAPLMSTCTCYTCTRFSRAYLHHLFAADEMLGPTLLSLHNVHYYMNLVARCRQAIEQGRWEAFRAEYLAQSASDAYDNRFNRHDAT
ncbi:MAG: tRNA guanosine(34) transglycosylase Tgt [Gemmataceae bacterium]